MKKPIKSSTMLRSAALVVSLFVLLGAPVVAQTFQAIILQTNLQITFPANTVITFPAAAPLELDNSSGITVQFPTQGGFSVGVQQGMQVEFPGEANPPLDLSNTCPS